MPYPVSGECRNTGKTRFKNGYKSHLKGTKLTAEHRKKLSEAHKGQVAWNKGLKGCISEDTRKKMSDSHTGENSPRWNGGTTGLSKCVRNLNDYKAWKFDVYQKYDSTCVRCGTKNHRVHAHHIVSFAELMEMFLAKNSGLCPIKDKDELVKIASGFAPFWDKKMGLCYAKTVTWKNTMQTLTKIFFILLLIPNTCLAVGMQAVVGNYGTVGGMTPSETCTAFVDEPSIVAYWDFEDASWDDEKASLSLVPINTPTFDTSTPIADLSSASFLRTSTESAMIANGDLPVGFPMTGTVTTFTLLGRFRSDTVGTQQYIVSKYGTALDERTLGLLIQSDGNLSINHGTTGGTGYTQLNGIATITAGDKYGFALTEDGSNGNYTFYLYNLTDSLYVTTVGVEAVATWPNTLNVEDSDFYIGGRDGSTTTFNGEIDDIVLANTIWDYEMVHEYFTALCVPATPDIIVPVLSTATLNEDNTNLTLSFSEPITSGAGGAGSFTATWSVSGATTYTYSSGTGTSTLVFTGSQAIATGETVTDGLDYTQPGNGWEDLSGNDLATVVDHPVLRVVDYIESFYVDCDGDGGDGSSGNPWNEADYNNEIWAAEEGEDGTIGPGDIVYFTGTTSDRFDLTGPGGVAGSGYVTLKFDSNFQHDGLAGYAIYIYDTDYVIIDGFKINASGVTSGAQFGIGIFAGSTNIKIINSEFRNLYGGTDQDGAGININGAGSERVAYITIGEEDAGNTFYQIGTDTGAGDITIEDAEDIYIGHNVMEGTTTAGIDGIVFLGSDRGLIEYNKIINHLDATGSDRGEDGIDLKGSHDVIIRYNYIAGNRVKGLNINVNEAGSAGYIATTDVYAYGNFFAGNNSHIAMSGSSGFTNLSDIYLWANILDQTTNDNYPGIYTNGYASAPVKIYNNTLYKANGTVDTSEDTPIYASNDPFDIRNCIIYSQTLTRVVGSYSNTTMTVDSGVYYSTGGAAQIRYDGTTYPALTVDTNGYVSDPDFVNAAADDFTPDVGSDAIGNGATIANGPPNMTIMGTVYDIEYNILIDADDVTYDPDGAPPVIPMVTQDASWDVGAVKH